MGSYRRTARDELDSPKFPDILNRLACPRPSFVTSHHSVALALRVEESLQLFRIAAELRTGGPSVDCHLSRQDRGERGRQLRPVGAGLHIRDTIDFGDDHKN